MVTSMMRMRPRYMYRTEWEATMADIKDLGDGTVMYGGKLYKKPPAWRMWVIYGLGLLMVFLIAGPWGVVIVLGFVWVAKLVGKAQEKREMREQQAFVALCQKEGVEHKPNYSDGERGFFLALNEQTGQFLLQYRAPMPADKLAWAT